MIYASLILTIYIFWRAILPTNLHWIYKLLLLGLLFGVSFKFHLLYYIGKPFFFAPDVPLWILWATSLLYAVVLIYFFILLFSDLLRLGIRLVRFLVTKKKMVVHKSSRNKMNLVLFLASLCLAIIGLYNGTSTPTIREQVIKSPNIPDVANGVKIAVLADLHADKMTRADFMAQVVELTNSAKPDIIIIAGDSVDGALKDRFEDLLPLSGLQAPLGVFGAPGNHEYYSGYEDWMTYFKSLGIRMLSNEHQELSDNQLIISGVADPAALMRNMEGPDVAKAIKGSNESFYRILIAHNPKVGKDAQNHHIDLQVSGHTHGGLILGFNQLVAAFNDGLVSGLYQKGGTQIFVSNGSGIWNGFPIRLGVPAEIVILTLQKQ